VRAAHGAGYALALGAQRALQAAARQVERLAAAVRLAVDRATRRHEGTHIRNGVMQHETGRAALQQEGLVEVARTGVAAIGRGPEGM